MPILLIDTDKNLHNITIFNKYLKKPFELSLASSSLISKKPSHFQNRTCLELLNLESIDFSITLDHTNNFMKFVSKQRNDAIENLVKILPDLETLYHLLNYEEKIIFAILKSFVRESKCIMLEDFDEYICTETLKEIKKALRSQSTEYDTYIFVKTRNTAYWIDVADSFIKIDETITLNANKLRSQIKIEHDSIAS